MAEERTENMVILVDDRDREIGLEEKMKAHRDGGKLHRAIRQKIHAHVIEPTAAVTRSATALLMRWYLDSEGR